MNRRFSELLWIVGGQAITALGTLVGVRVLTQFLEPAAYGVVSLALGISTLVITLIAAPLTQAAMHYYPAMAAGGSSSQLLKSLRRSFVRMIPWIALAGAIGAVVYMMWGGGTPVLIFILLVLLASDCWRSANLSLLNAARKHRRYGIWTAADAWGRPLLGTAAVLSTGHSPVVVLAAYAIVSVLLVVALSDHGWRDDSNSAVGLAPVEASALDARLWSYALPLVPLGILSWASNLGDRYIIGGVLGVADAGVYAALYGLSAMPFMVVNGTLEQGLRPIYQTAVSKADRVRAATILRLWLGASIAICATGVLMFTLGHELIANLLVGKAYRYASELMPWISAGYALRAVSYVFERVCYAYGQTRHVLTIQIGAVLAAAIATPIGVLTLGLTGAAMAVPACFAVQLTMAVVLARRTLRETTRTTGTLGLTA